MKLGLMLVIWLFCLCSSQAFASNFLKLACKDDETKGYCVALLRGFLSGYEMGHLSGTHNAQAASGDRGPELCIPRDLTSEDIYNDMYPHLSKDLGFLDLSLFAAALSAYPCGAEK